jgi:hypothetical protein
MVIVVVMATVVVLLMEAVVVEVPVVLVVLDQVLLAVQEVLVFKFQQYSETHYLLLVLIQVQPPRELVV